MKGISKVVVGIGLIFILLICLILTVSSYASSPIQSEPAYVWWSGTPDFVINVTSNYTDGTLDSTYPSEDALRLGHVNELFGTNTTYPSTTLTTANWSHEYNEGTEIEWIDTLGGRIKGTYVRVAGDHDNYVYNLSKTYTANDDFAFQVELNCSSQSAFIQACVGMSNSTTDYTSSYANKIRLVLYKATAGCNIAQLQWRNSTDYITNASDQAITTDVVYIAKCYWDADGSEDGAYPLFMCRIYTKSTGAFLKEYRIDFPADTTIYVDQFGTFNIGGTASNQAGSVIMYTDNYIFNNKSIDYLPTSGDWISSDITIDTDKKLKNMTINFTTATTQYNITKVEWLNSTGDIKATNTTDIITSGLVTYSTANGLSTGSFDYLNDTEDLKIRVYLEGNGTDTPIFYDIIGFYEDGPVPPSTFSLGNLYWIESYEKDNTTNIEFAQNQTLQIKANISGIITGAPGMDYPLITIYYPNGTAAINSQDMTNETVFYNNTPIIYNYSFIINDTKAGFYDVKIENRLKNHIFYNGQVWNNNWTNRTGTTFPFKLKINLSDEDIIDRRWEVIDQWVNFSYTAHNNSIRVGYYNNSHIIEIPSQVYNNTSNADGTFADANIVFLTSLERNTNKTFYVYYSKADLCAPNYDTDLTSQNNSNRYIFNNSKYNITNNQTQGGIIQYAKCYNTSYQDLEGTDPFEEGAKIDWTFDDPKAISDVSSPEFITYITGPIFSKLQINSRYILIGGTAYYNLTYTYYAHNPYYIEEINTTSPSSDNWDYYNDFEFTVADGIFNNVSWKNTTDTYTYLTITGNGDDDYTGLTGTDWVAFYNNDTGLSYGDIFLTRRFSDDTTPTFTYYDTASYEIYRRKITGTFIPGAGDYFYAKKAGVIWNGLTYMMEFNETYYKLTNPVNITVNQISDTYDTINPQFHNNTVYLNYTPSSPTDSQNIICYSFWTDNLGMSNVDLIENSTGTNVTHSAFQTTLGNLSGWANYTIDATSISPGNITCNFTGYDIASLTNTTSFTFHVSDATEPLITNISYVPTSSADLDVNTVINITVNITDAGTVNTVILQNRTDDAGIWTNTSMDLLSGTLYNALFIPRAEANHTIKIIANDSANNVNISSSQNITVQNDKTWYLIPATFTEITTQSGQSENVTNVTINNTGDSALNFSVVTSGHTTGVESQPYTEQVKYYISNNGYVTSNKNVTIAAGSSENVTIELTAYINDPKSSDITINVTANETAENATSQICTGTFISSIVGPFFELTFYDYPSSIYQRNSSSVVLKITNIGSADGTNVWINYTLPTSWSVGATDSETKLIDILFSGRPSNWNNITNLTIGSSASTGEQTLFVEANSSQGGYNNNITIYIIETSETPSKTPDTTPPSTGGGGTSGGMTGAQAEKLFQTSELYEMTIGEDTSFTMVVENPYPNSTMHNVTLSVTGLLSKYIEIYPEIVEDILLNKSTNFTIKITAPSYFTAGEHELIFYIRSTVKNLLTGTKSQMIEERIVRLAVHEVSRETATSLLDEAEKLLEEMIENGFYTSDIEELFNRAISELSERDYETVQSLYNQIKQIRDNAVESSSLIAELEDRIYRAINFWGLSTDKTSRIITLAKLSFMRGDYGKAMDRIKEAQLTFALETKGEYNIPFIIVTYWYWILLGMIISIIAGYLSYGRIKMSLLSYKIKSRIKEEQILLGLMKQLQKDAFQKKKMSMSEYNNTMLTYSRRLNKVVKDIIKFETQRSHVFRFGSEEKSLLAERKKLVAILKKTQHDYLTKGRTETSVYMNKMRSYSERLSEIQEKLSTLEAKKALKHKRVKLLRKRRK